MTRCTMLVVAVLGAISLASCLTTTASIPSWESFNGCSEQMPFHQWVMCGKANRDAACAADRCKSGPNANEVMAYVDRLDQSVLHKEISEVEARAKWTKFRDERENAAAAASTQSVRATQDRGTAAAAACGSAVSC
jgi:hypothetical protein